MARDGLYAAQLHANKQACMGMQASPFTDWLVWRKVAAKLGGKVQLVRPVLPAPAFRSCLVRFGDLIT